MSNDDLVSITQEVHNCKKWYDSLGTRGDLLKSEVESSFNLAARDFPLPEGVRMVAASIIFDPIRGYLIPAMTENLKGEIIVLDTLYMESVDRAIVEYVNSTSWIYDVTNCSRGIFL